MVEDSDPSQLLESFIRHVQTLATDTSYQYLKGILEDNATLKDRNNVLSITNEENFKTLAKLQQQLADEAKRNDEQNAEVVNLTTENADLTKKVTTLEGEAETTRAQLNESTEEISKLETDLIDRDAEIQKTTSQLTESTDEIARFEGELSDSGVEIETLKTGLHDARDENTRLQADVSFRDSEIEGLKACCEEERMNLAAASQQHLHTMFTLAYKWAEGLFTDDLDQGVFVASSSAHWAKIRNHNRVNRIIPLPLSNSPEAKQMRIAAILAILAWSFARYIFQPSYLLQCNELSDLLSGLADDEPARETYLRSVLLPVLPSKQKANGKKRIEQVVLDVFACVKPVLAEGKQAALRVSLENMCKQVCGQWMRLQLLEEKIEPSFDAYDDEDWKLLQLPFFDDATPGDATNGGPEEAGDDPEDAAANPECSGNNSSDSAMTDDSISDIEDIAAIVWPSFLSFRGGESELLTEGFVLDKSQVKVAYHEEKAALLQGIHRAARQITRRDRTKSFATNGEEVAQAKAFLPPELVELPPESADGLEGGG
ncbi:hypothetical protein BJ170DRAFT_595083 [Xylariales sp. AK1849]|nr:hypothetical protein BJ170DRAFT_595083 [Xylariales sp. AK1849]